MVDASAMMMQVNLFVSGRKLKDLDTFSKSDPQCRLLEFKNNQWQEIGRTEVVMNNLNLLSFFLQSRLQDQLHGRLLLRKDPKIQVPSRRRRQWR
jgi:hypothetical protein